MKGDYNNAIADLSQASVLNPSAVIIKKMLQQVQNDRLKNKNGC